MHRINCWNLSLSICFASHSRCPKTILCWFGCRKFHFIGSVIVGGLSRADVVGKKSVKKHSHQVLCACVSLFQSVQLDFCLFDSITFVLSRNFFKKTEDQFGDSLNRWKFYRQRIATAQDHISKYWNKHILVSGAHQLKSKFILSVKCTVCSHWHTVRERSRITKKTKEQYYWISHCVLCIVKGYVWNRSICPLNVDCVRILFKFLIEEWLQKWSNSFLCDLCV